MLNLDFSERDRGLVSLTHFCMVFQEKYFSCCILLTDQVFLSICLNLLRHWAICVHVVFFINEQVAKGLT